jgi:hypothetical protein
VGLRLGVARGGCIERLGERGAADADDVDGADGELNAERPRRWQRRHLLDESHKNQTGQTRPADGSDHGIGQGPRLRIVLSGRNAAPISPNGSADQAARPAAASDYTSDSSRATTREPTS